MDASLVNINFIYLKKLIFEHENENQRDLWLCMTKIQNI